MRVHSKQTFDENTRITLDGQTKRTVKKLQTKCFMLQQQKLSKKTWRNN